MWYAKRINVWNEKLKHVTRLPQGQEHGRVEWDCDEHVAEGQVLQQSQTYSVKGDCSALGGGPQNKTVTWKRPFLYIFGIIGIGGRTRSE